MGQIQAIVNKHTIMGNFDKDIPILMDFIGDPLAKDLMMNRGAYAITNPAARDKIFYTALTTAYVAMKRGYKEGDRRFWNGSTQEITTRVDGGHDKSKLSQFLGWGKR